MNFKANKLGGMVAIAAAAGLTPGLASAVLVDSELSLVVDVSGSISSSEYNLQMDGYANAFRDSTVQSNILGGSQGSIAVNTVFFASSAFTTDLDDFVLLDSASAIDGYADTLDDFIRPGSGGTSINTGMDKSRDSLTGDNGFESDNLIMDVSGDGTSSYSFTDDARDAAAAAGITVNGLPIGSQFISDFYTDHVVTSDGFVTSANGFDDFDDAIKEKLRIETGGGTVSVPEPATFLLLGAGLVGMAGYGRRRRIG